MGQSAKCLLCKMRTWFWISSIHGKKPGTAACTVATVVPALGRLRESHLKDWEVIFKMTSHSSDVPFPQERKSTFTHIRDMLENDSQPRLTQQSRSSWSPPSEWVPKGRNWLDGRGSRWQRVSLAAGQKVDWRVRIQGSHRGAAKQVSASSYKGFRRSWSQDPDFNNWVSARILLNCLCPLIQNHAHIWLRGSKN